MKHSPNCTATGSNDIDPQCQACVAQRLERSMGYPALLSISEQEQEWDDYERDMRRCKPWNDGIDQ